jgi:hypothetical protein
MYESSDSQTMRAEIFVEGTPYPWHKVRGDVEGPERWSAAIRQQTEKLPAVSGPCRLEVEFVLPRDRFPRDHPYGTDLDNLLKRLLDALKVTVLRTAPGLDGAIVELRASKVPAGTDGIAGARIVLTDDPWKWAIGGRSG